MTTVVWRSKNLSLRRKSKPMTLSFCKLREKVCSNLCDTASLGRAGQFAMSYVGNKTGITLSFSRITELKLYHLSLFISAKMVKARETDTIKSHWREPPKYGALEHHRKCHRVKQFILRLYIHTVSAWKTKKMLISPESTFKKNVIPH